MASQPDDGGWHGSYDVVQALLGANADVNAQDGSGGTALIAASQEGTWLRCRPCSPQRLM